MKPETRKKLSDINRDVPGIIANKAREKILLLKDSWAVYFAAMEILLVFGIAVSFFIFIDPDINVIPAEKMPNTEKIIYFAAFAAIALLLFSYNKKFFSQAARNAKWEWKWKAKK